MNCGRAANYALHRTASPRLAGLPPLSSPLPRGADLGDIYVREDGAFVIVWEAQQPQNDGPWIIRNVCDSSRPVQVRLRVYVKRGDHSPRELAWSGNPQLYPWEDRDTRVGHDFSEPPQGGDLLFVPVCGRVTS